MAETSFTGEGQLTLSRVPSFVFSLNLLNCSRPHSLDEIGIGGLAAVLPHERSDLSAVIDTVKSDMQRHVAQLVVKLLSLRVCVSELSGQIVG
jgi:hypothetical protein